MVEVITEALHHLKTERRSAAANFHITLSALLAGGALCHHLCFGGTALATATASRLAAAKISVISNDFHVTLCAL